MQTNQRSKHIKLLKNLLQRSNLIAHDSEVQTVNTTEQWEALGDIADVLSQICEHHQQCENVALQSASALHQYQRHHHRVPTLLLTKNPGLFQEFPEPHEKFSRTFSEPANVYI